MNRVDKLIGKMRRLWVLEQCARRGLLIAGLCADAVLACLLLGRAAKLPEWSMLVVLAAGAAGLIVLVAAAVIRAPHKKSLAQALDERTGKDDLFASALEFSGDRQNFGPLGELTCELAAERALAATPGVRWSLGSKPKWIALASVAAVLIAGNVVLSMSATHQVAQQAPVAAVNTQTRILTPSVLTPTPTKGPESLEPTSAPTMIEESTQPASAPTSEPTRITSEMIDKYLAELPTEKVDLEGVTPIRWDEDEKSGKNNPDPNKPPEKIDPVKLDPGMLKDLAAAKKEKDESGAKEGGVDVAVMSDKPGDAAKGKEGGKKGDETLAGAVSKDPRGDARRLGIPLERKGMQVRSAARFPTKQKGEDRPMDLLAFLAAMERVKLLPAQDPTIAGGTGGSEENVVRQELLPESAAGLSDAYFSELRKADR